MLNIRIIVKRSPIIKKIYENVIFYRKNNLFKTKYPKRALLSYSVMPFKNKSRAHIHPNYIENYTLAEILNRYAYIVDVYNNTFPGKIRYEKYDLIVGEGLPISNYFLNKKHKNIIPTVYYATGSHPFFNNIQSYSSLFVFYKKHRKYLPLSSRLVDFNWGIGASLSDYVVLLGNNNTKITFQDNCISKNIYNLNPPYYDKNVVSDFSKKDNSKFLWFGSYGLIHKDLNAIIEIFHEMTNLELHICGYLDAEVDFMATYKEMLSNSPNIFIHGFININSVEFRKIMEECSFVILSSCAEGCTTAVVTAMGNGGLIPLISKQCGLDIINGVIFEDNNFDNIKKAIQNINKLYTVDMIKRLSYENIHYINQYFSIDQYEKEINGIFSDIFRNLENETTAD
jgi:hypothetical protein